jgi:hypothetical protein
MLVFEASNSLVEMYLIFGIIVARHCTVVMME